MTRRPTSRLVALAGVTALAMTMAACSSDAGDD